VIERRIEAEVERGADHPTDGTSGRSA